MAIDPLERIRSAALTINRLIRTAFGLRPYLRLRLPTLGNWKAIRSYIAGPIVSFRRCASTPYFTVAPRADSFAAFSLVCGEIRLGPSNTLAVMRPAAILREDAKLNEKLRLPSPTNSAFPLPFAPPKLKLKAYG